MIYIYNKLRYKTRNDQKLYKERRIRFTFLEIIEPNKKKLIGYISKHPNVIVTEFKNDYLDHFYKEVFVRQKKKILIGDFNIKILR